MGTLTGIAVFPTAAQVVRQLHRPRQYNLARRGEHTLVGVGDAVVELHGHAGIGMAQPLGQRPRRRAGVSVVLGKGFAKFLRYRRSASNESKRTGDCVVKVSRGVATPNGTNLNKPWTKSTAFATKKARFQSM